MTIRKARTEDIDFIMDIFEKARLYMIKSGNPDQWEKGYPQKELLLSDMKKGFCYVIEEGSIILGTFTFILGTDPTYIHIQGKWLNEKPYGTIHRIASSGEKKGLFHEAIKFCTSINPNIRIDTHEKNSTMLHLLEKEGFAFCGKIKCHNGTERIAFQRDFDD